VRQIKTSCSIL